MKFRQKTRNQVQGHHKWTQTRPIWMRIKKGDVSVKMSTCFGTMIKEFMPYTLDSWESLSEDLKQKIWNCVKLKFNIDDIEKKTIFQKLGKLWRGRKSTLQINIRRANESRMPSRSLALLKPEFMEIKDWNTFVKNTLSPEFQEKSARYQQMQAKQEHVHTMSRQGYARLYENMETYRVDVWIQGHTKKNGQLSNEAVAELLKKLKNAHQNLNRHITYQMMQ